MNVMTEKVKPWYHEPWPWILMAGPAIVVVAALATAWLAATTDDGLVEDDYYKSGLGINQTIERDQAAHDLHIKAQLMVGDTPTHVRLMLQAGESGALPRELRLKVMHPTRTGQDQVVVMMQSGDGMYVGEIKALGAARWRLALEDADNRWRLTGTWRVPKDSVVVLDSRG
jgi:hypothetical protein